MRSQTKLRLFDWLILLAVLLGVAILATFLRGKGSAEEAELAVEYILLLPPSDRPLQIAPGSIVHNESGTVTLGKVTEVRDLPYREAYLRDRKIVYGEVGDLRSVEVSVRTVAFRRLGQGIRAGEIRLAAGSTGNYRIGNRFIPGAFVTSVRILNASDGEEIV